MAIPSRGSDSNKILGELAAKMRSSCVDSHYTWKYWVRLNPNDATKPIDAPRDDTFFGSAMTRLLLLPVWLPYWYWKRRQTKSEMREFVVAGASGRLVDDELMRQLALEWVGLHPREFIFAEHDPKVAELQTNFGRILSERA